MSDATTELYAPDGVLLGYSIYQGSAGLIHPGVYATVDEAWDNRRQVHPGYRNPWDILAACSHDGEDAYAYSHYGGGFHWPTKVCRSCGCVTGRLSPYLEDYGYSIPSIEQQAADDAWLKADWPKNGPPPNVRDVDAPL